MYMLLWWCMKKDLIDFGIAYVKISVGLLFTLMTSLCVYVLAVPKYEYYKYYLYLVDIQTLKILDFLFISSISGFE